MILGAIHEFCAPKQLSCTLYYANVRPRNLCLVSKFLHDRIIAINRLRILFFSIEQLIFVFGNIRFVYLILVYIYTLDSTVQNLVYSQCCVIHIFQVGWICNTSMQTRNNHLQRVSAQHNQSLCIILQKYYNYLCLYLIIEGGL